MKKRIAIVGGGYVGRSVEQLFTMDEQYKPRLDGHGNHLFAVSIYDTGYQTQQHHVMGADIAFICVPTPANAIDGSVDIQAVESSVAFLDAPLIVIKSTVPPGTTDYLGSKYNKSVHFCPEFIVERSPTETPDVGVMVAGPKYERVLEYYQKVLPSHARLIGRVDPAELELAKYMDNAYFATKVIFCNEFYNIAEAFGLDYNAVRELWLNDPRIEADHTMVFPGERGFSGKCLPKDLSGIIAKSRETGYPARFLHDVREANRRIRNEAWNEQMWLERFTEAEMSRGPVCYRILDRVIFWDVVTLSWQIRNRHTWEFIGRSCPDWDRFAGNPDNQQFLRDLERRLSPDTPEKRRARLTVVK